MRWHSLIPSWNFCNGFQSLFKWPRPGSQIRWLLEKRLETGHASGTCAFHCFSRLETSQTGLHHEAWWLVKALKRRPSAQISQTLDLPANRKLETVQWWSSQTANMSFTQLYTNTETPLMRSVVSMRPPLLWAFNARHHNLQLELLGISLARPDVGGSFRLSIPGWYNFLHTI